MFPSTPIDPYKETVGDAAPRLTDCMDRLIAELERRRLVVETVETYVLDSSDYKLRVPCAVNGVPIQVTFSAGLPAWSDRIRVSLQIRLADHRRWSVYEPFKGFQVPRIVTRIRKELATCRQEQEERLKKTRKSDRALERFAELKTALGVSSDDPLSVSVDNLQITGFHDYPYSLRVTVETTYSKVAKLIEDFRKPGWYRQ